MGIAATLYSVLAVLLACVDSSRALGASDLMLVVAKESRKVSPPRAQFSDTTGPRELLRAKASVQQRTEGGSHEVDKEHFDEWWRAIRRGDVVTLRGILLRKAVDSTREAENLLTAYAWDHVDNRLEGQSDALEKTPLLWAAAHNDLELAETLLSGEVVQRLGGASLRRVFLQRDRSEREDGRTALMDAVRLGRTEVVRAMLSEHVLLALGHEDAAAVVAAQDVGGRTALMHAVDARCARSVQLLLREDVVEMLDAASLHDLLQSEVRSGYGRPETVLIAAARSGDAKLVRSLLSEAVMSRLGPQLLGRVLTAKDGGSKWWPRTALMHAAVAQDAAVVQQLLAPRVVAHLGERAHVVLQQLFEESETRPEELTVLEALERTNGLDRRLKRLVLEAAVFGGGGVTKDVVERYIREDTSFVRALGLAAMRAVAYFVGD